jgi:hypothetical protein
LEVLMTTVLIPLAQGGEEPAAAFAGGAKREEAASVPGREV